MTCAAWMGVLVLLVAGVLAAGAGAGVLAAIFFVAAGAVGMYAWILSAISKWS